MVEIQANIDDLSAEILAASQENLLQAGALEVFFTPVQMKKNRPGVLLSIIAPEPAIPALETILFRETGTFGIRRHRAERSKLQREKVTVETPWGSVTGKRGWRNDGLAVFSPEFEDCARLARQTGVALGDVYRAVQEAYYQTQR